MCVSLENKFMYRQPKDVGTNSDKKKSANPLWEDFTEPFCNHFNWRAYTFFPPYTAAAAARKTKPPSNGQGAPKGSPQGGSSPPNSKGMADDVIAEKNRPQRRNTRRLILMRLLLTARKFSVIQYWLVGKSKQGIPCYKVRLLKPSTIFAPNLTGWVPSSRKPISLKPTIYYP